VIKHGLGVNTGKPLHELDEIVGALQEEVEQLRVKVLQLEEGRQISSHSGGGDGDEYVENNGAESQSKPLAIAASSRGTGEDTGRKLPEAPREGSPYSCSI
jgi:hypothetical protein